jgi:protein-tyrosine-phosphatase
MKILFICSGNTCRSPMAEALFASIARERGIEASAESAGQNAHNGQKAAEHAVSAMRELYAIDLSSHRSKQLTVELINVADLVLCMTKAQDNEIRRLFPHSKIDTIGGWSGQEQDVLDPFGCGKEDYRACAQQLETMLRVGIEKMGTGGGSAKERLLS